MKYMLIIVLISITHIQSMDYKKALTKKPLVSIPKQVSKTSSAHTAEISEETEIIDFLRAKQSRPHQVKPLLDTQEVKRFINETWTHNHGYLSKTEIALAINTPQARQWLLENCNNSDFFHEVLQTLIVLITNNETSQVKQLLEWTTLDSCGNSFLVRYNHPTIKYFSFTDMTFNNPDMLSLMLAAGSNLDGQDKNGNSPLHRACIHSNENAAKILLSFNAKTNLANQMGETPLHIACTSGDFALVSLLLDNYANANAINPKSSQFETPLLCALKGCQDNPKKDSFYCIIEKLISKTIPKRADYTQLNDQGICAQDIVRRLPNNHVVYRELKELIPAY